MSRLHAESEESAPERAADVPRPDLRATQAQLLLLQRTAGNRAVGRVLARYGFNAGDGTTTELQAEHDRLVQERDQCYRNLLWGSQICDNTYGRDVARLETLLAERGDSTLPDAAQTLRFDGHTLTMTGPGGGSWSAVSGRPDPSGSFDYSPARQRMENVGPIPAGEYWIDPRQMHDLRDKWFGWQWLEGDAWGTHRITIHPFSATHDFGRGGFFIHGGSTPGSAGCIDLTTNMAAFAGALSIVPPGQKVRLTVSY